MKKILLICLILGLLLITACCKNKCRNSGTKQNNYNYTGSMAEDNYVWGGAMNLAWNELNENIVGEAVQLDTSDAEALAITAKLNDPVFSKKDMDVASYYIKSGYGQKTVSAINSECRAKFPRKSIPDLKIELGEKDIISYAYFLKEITYQKVFSKQNISFMDEPVQGFRVSGESYQNIYILDYQNEDKFLIGIKLEDAADQIFLGKGYPMDKPDDVVKDLRAKAPAQKLLDNSLGETMNSKDLFHAPMLHLSHERAYEEMIGKALKNKKFTAYMISVMQEIIKFDMDEKGARVENEAFIGMVTSFNPNANVYKPKKMILDKPYWVMMKRFDSSSPYFILGVQNSRLMKPID